MPKKQKSGLYRTKVKIGVDANGKDVFKWISAKTKRELEDRRRAVVEIYIEGRQPQQDVLFGVYAKQWFDTRVVGHLAKETAGDYRTIINKWFMPALGEMNLRAISAKDIQALVNSFPQTSARTIENRMAVIRGIFASAMADKLISFNPTLGVTLPISRKPNKRRALTEAETDVILGLIAPTKIGMFIAILYYLGVRRAEAAALQWGDIDWHKRIVHIRGTKTNAADRFAPMPDALYEFLFPLRQLPSTYIIHHDDNAQLPYSQNALGKLFAKAMSDAGIQEITPHYLRHNYITMAWRNGVDVMVVSKIVGHANPATTQSIYTDLTNADIESKASAINAMFEREVAEKLHKL